jgi:hypothetical protein
MKTKNIKGKIAYLAKRLVFFFALSFTVNTYSQQDLTIHLMPIIPQSSYTNPAFQPIPKWYIGFPALSSVYMGIGHSGFAYNDLFHHNTVEDSLNVTIGNMISKLAKVNYLSTNLSEELLCFGFKAGKGYFDFSYGIKANFQFSYPRDLIKLAWQGNGQFVGSKADFSGIGINASLYKELAIGYSRNVKIDNQNFVFGIRVKMLNGLMNVYTQKSTATWGIDQSDFGYSMNTNFKINMDIPTSAAESLDSMGSNTYNGGNNNLTASQFIFNPTNKGYGVDLGASYKYSNKWTFGLSVLDLGFINWKTGSGSSVRNYSSNVSNFNFDGIDISQFLGMNDSLQKIKTKAYEDSLKNIFKIKSTQNSYKAPLGTKFYLTAEYSLTRHDVAGLLFRGEMLNGRLHPSATVSYNKWFGNMFSASLSYSMENRSYNNVGLGMALNLGPWQIYVLTDNFYCLINPEGTKTINLHFGWNFIFGYKESKPNETMYRDYPDMPKAEKQ